MTLLGRKVRVIARSLVGKLPLALAMRLAKGRPNVAFYIRRDRTLLFSNYLGDLKVNIDTLNNIERRMLSGTYEKHTLAVISSVVEAGDVCLDIGANIGAITFALAKATGPNGVVHAFEPGPPFFLRLQKNVAMNPVVGARIHLHRCGLSDASGTLPWQEDSTNPGNAHIHWADSERGVTVPVTTLDTFAKTANLPRVDFIKIDVEGMEDAVMRGATKMIASHRPTLFYESLCVDNEQTKLAIKNAEILRAAGYAVFKVLDDAGTVRETETDFSTDTLAVHRSREVYRRLSRT